MFQKVYFVKHLNYCADKGGDNLKLKDNILNYVGLLVTCRMDECVKEIVMDGIGTISEYAIDYGVFQEKMTEYIQRHGNQDIREQLDDLLNNLGQVIYTRIREQDLHVLDEVEKLLEEGFEIKEINPEIRNVLKEDLMCQILHYTRNRDILFYNQLIAGKENQEVISAIERRLLQLEKILSAYLKNQDFPLKENGKYLHINDIDRIDMRVSEIEKIRYGFRKNSNVVFLYGRPGIGKTTLARLYAREYVKQGGTVFFEKYEKSIEYTVGKLAKNQGKNAAREILNYWRKQEGTEREKILLIIDNFNEDYLQGCDKEHFNKELKGDYYKELIDLGIKILFTTRINIENNVYTVEPVENPVALFVRYSEMTESDIAESEQLIKDVISIVKANTLLIILVAQLWKRIDMDKKYDLLNKLKCSRLIEQEETVVVSADIDAKEDMTVYEQVSALLDFSGILNDVEVHRVFVNAVLLPNEGMNKFVFMKLINCQNDNGLYRLIRNSWILCDYSHVYVHPVVREIAFRNNLVTYEFCYEYCKNINDLIRIELPFEKRFVYKKYAEEIYNRFKIIDELDDVLVNLFYRLSDIYDNLAEPHKSAEVINRIHYDIEKVIEEPADKARMLSGIAYSLNNYYDSMETLEQARKLLDNARELIGEDKNNCELKYVQAYGRILSNYGSNSLAKSKCDLAKKKEYLEEALNWHKEALTYRKKKRDCYKDEVILRSIDSEIAVSYTTVATDYFYLEQYDKAIEYHLYACEIRESLHLEREKNVNSQRIIGCIIAWYKKNAIIEQHYIEQALNYYPRLLQSSYTFGMLNVVRENLKYFIQLVDMVKKDNCLDVFKEEIREKGISILAWLNGEERLNELFKVEVGMLNENLS